MPMRSGRDLVAARIGVLLTAISAGGGLQTNPEAVPPVLPASLGSLHHPIRTSNPDVQILMDRGVTLYYGFNRDAARRSFAAATRADPDAAMPWVGLAL